MAHRIADLPDDDPDDWPDLEDELIPDEVWMPNMGAFDPSFQYLHGARVTLDAGLMHPTRLLTAAAAKVLLKVAGEQEIGIPKPQADRFESFARGHVDAEQDALLQALAELAAFLETQVQSP